MNEYHLPSHRLTYRLHLVLHTIVELHRNVWSTHRAIHSNGRRNMRLPRHRHIRYSHAHGTHRYIAWALHERQHRILRHRGHTHRTRIAGIPHGTIDGFTSRTAAWSLVNCLFASRYCAVVQSGCDRRRVAEHLLKGRIEYFRVADEAHIAGGRVYFPIYSQWLSEKGSRHRSCRHFSGFCIFDCARATNDRITIFNNTNKRTQSVLSE